MHWTQIVLAATLTIYLGAFAAILVAVKRGTGVNPIGHGGGHRLVGDYERIERASEAAIWRCLHQNLHDFLASQVRFQGRPDEFAELDVIVQSGECRERADKALSLVEIGPLPQPAIRVLDGQFVKIGRCRMVG